MPIKTKVHKIGNSYGIVLPKEALLALKVEAGASLYLTEAPNNTLNINPERPGFDEKMDTVEDLMQRFISMFGGSDGVPDEHALDTSLGRPLQHYSYKKPPVRRQKQKKRIHYRRAFSRKQRIQTNRLRRRSRDSNHSLSR